jgi:hypothetical protein
MSFGFIAALLVIGLAVCCTYIRFKRNPLPIKFKSFDELNSVTDTARWAQRQLEASDPLRKALRQVITRLDPNPFYTAFPVFSRISAQDLACWYLSSIGSSMAKGNH